MVPDFIKHYENHPALQFIESVGVDWNTTKVLDAEVGDFITVVRQEKSTENWFLGAITDENERTVNVKLGFLDPNRTYVTRLYKDTPDAHYKNNSEVYEIEKKSQ